MRDPLSIADAATVARDPQRLQALCDLWQSAQRDVWMTLRGESMVPTILPGSRLRIQCRRDLPTVGELVAFRHGGTLVVHRVTAVQDDPAGGARRLVCQGDGNPWPDAPVTLDQVLGAVVCIQAPGVWARACYFLRSRLRPVRNSIRSHGRAFMTGVGKRTKSC